jgi:hypothetical protein
MNVGDQATVAEVRFVRQGSTVPHPQERTIASYSVHFLEYLAITLFFLSCAEPFPTYKEPESVLDANLEVTVVDTIEVVKDRETGQWYLVSSPLIFAVRVTNAHDDLLAGEAEVEGLITVTAFTETPKSFGVGLVGGNLLAPQIVDGEIAIEPGGEALLRAFAHPILEDGTLLIEGELGGPIYGPILCLASGSIRIFTRVQPVQLSQVEFAVIFRESSAP